VIPFSIPEEEISAMRAELEKYGIQMPTFSKIGGILANELSQDDAALHAAIIAINEAIETRVAADIMTALGNPAANLVGINGKLGEQYMNSLYDAKHTKTENTKNKVSLVEVRLNIVDFIAINMASAYWSS